MAKGTEGKGSPDVRAAGKVADLHSKTEGDSASKAVGKDWNKAPCADGDCKK